MAEIRIDESNSRTWEPHPQFPGVLMATLLSHQRDQTDMTCALVQVPVGSKPERHMHEHSDDILYVLHGKAKIWIEGIGDVPLAQGTFVRIPKGTKHQPHSIEEDILLFNIWYPFTW